LSIHVLQLVDIASYWENLMGVLITLVVGLWLGWIIVSLDEKNR